MAFIYLGGVNFTVELIFSLLFPPAVVVDTNKWYHQTYIHPGSISITIGSEYR